MPEQSEQQKLKYSPEYQSMLDDVPKYLKKHEISEEIFLYWEGEAKKRLDRLGNKFEFFEQGNDALVKIGDSLLMDRKSTGYNLLNDDVDMELCSDKPLLFYNCHIGRTWHFGLLLAKMEKDGLISRKRGVRFGNKATKVLYDPRTWDVMPEDEFIDDFGIAEKVVKTVETIITFTPDNSHDGTNVADIAEFLLDNTDANRLDHRIPGSWYVQDIRGTMALEPLLKLPAFSNKFGVVMANVLHQGKSSIIALRSKSKLDPKEWSGFETIVDLELIKYLTEFGVVE